MDDYELDRRTRIPYREIINTMKMDVLCKHDIIAEWCWECKHKKPSTVKSLLLQENLKIVRNLLSWETKTHTT